MFNDLEKLQICILIFIVHVFFLSHLKTSLLYILSISFGYYSFSPPPPLYFFSTTITIITSEADPNFVA